MYGLNHISVGLRDRLVYGFSCFGKDLVYGLVSCIIFLYCIQVLNISITFLGILYLSHHVLGAILCPFFGTLVDHTKSRIGKYKPYIIIGAIINSIAIVGFCLIDQFPYDFRYFYLSVIYIIWSCSYFLIDVPSWATLSIFNTNVATRDSMAAIPSMSNVLGSQILAIGVLPVLSGASDFLNIQDISYVFICLISAVILICSQAAYVFLLKTSSLDQNHLPSHFIPPSLSTENKDTAADNSQSDLNMGKADNLYNSYMMEHTNYNQAQNARDFYDQISTNANEGLNVTNNHSSFAKVLNVNLLKINPFKQVKRMSRIIFSNDQLLVLFSCSILLNTMAGLIFGALINSFLDQQLLEHSNLYFIIIAAALIQCAFMATFESFARHTPRSWILNGSVVVAMVTFIMSCITTANNSLFYALIACCMFIGSGCIGLCRVAVSSMTIDTVDYGEFKFNLRTDGLIFAVRSMAKHLGVLIAFFFYGGAISLGTHFNAAENIVPTISLNWAITTVVLLGCSAIIIFSMYYKLNGAFYRNILNNLQYLRQNQRADSSNDNNDVQHFMLRYCLDESTMIIKLQARNLDDLIKALVQKLAKVNAITSELDYMQDLKARLALGPCGIAEGIALPHAKSSSVRRATVVVATLDEPLDLGALDGRKCDLVFLLASPDDGETHLNLLGRLSLLLNEQGFADKLRTSGSPTELFERLIQCEKHIVK